MLPLGLLLAFLAVPVVEIYVILQVAHLIGGWPTVALLVLESVVGTWIVRREGRRAWRALTSTFQEGGMPDRELADAAVVLVGGVLLVTPGFITDVFGFLFVLPFTRPLVRSLLTGYATRRVRAAQERAMRSFAGFGGEQEAQAGNDATVVRGEVIQEDRDGDPR